MLASETAAEFATYLFTSLRSIADNRIR